MRRRILHLDMDAFFTAVEERRRPHLRGKPVVVGGRGDPAQRGVVSTANYEARKYGIHSAMPLRTAHRLCPSAVFLPVDYAEYSRISNIIKTILKKYTTVVEDAGIDEAYLDISGSSQSPEEIGRRIREEIFRETSLTCSIGIAPNKLVAKVASDLKKPEGLTIVREEDVKDVLAPLPVRKLHGVGPKTELRLKEIGVHTVAQLRSLGIEDLVDLFGTSHGYYLYDASRGIDERPLVTEWERKSIGSEVTFQRDLEKSQEVAERLHALTTGVVEEMRSLSLKGRTVVVKVRYSDFSTRTRSRTLPAPADSLDMIQRVALDNLARFDLQGKKIRLIGVRMEGLVRQPPGPETSQPSPHEYRCLP